MPRLLEQRGISARELARRIGIEQGYVSLVVTGKRAPSRKLLERAAEALGLRPDYWREYRESEILLRVRGESGSP